MGQQASTLTVFLGMRVAHSQKRALYKCNVGHIFMRLWKRALVLQCICMSHGDTEGCGMGNFSRGQHSFLLWALKMDLLGLSSFSVCCQYDW
jgi:hypothetical protein